ncbi:protein phosphatase 2C domain-containing protein, partial [Pyrobaculum sp.]|uniref:protein phosphatase 2C domain-containing protein n=1 Tax=Pyrobaculum sp. TaxID=2004705 RepID=UPI003D144B5A
ELGGRGGTTLSVAVAVAAEGHPLWLGVANVGDSAVYLIRPGGSVEVLTQSDRVEGNVISQALGVRLSEVHVRVRQISGGCVGLVAMSDGVDEVLDKVFYADVFTKMMYEGLGGPTKGVRGRRKRSGGFSARKYVTTVLRAALALTRDNATFGVVAYGCR